MEPAKYRRRSWPDYLGHAVGRPQDRKPAALQEIPGLTGRGAARRPQETRTGYSRQSRQCTSTLPARPVHEIGAREPAIVVGNVTAKSLRYRSLRKSAIDAWWSQLRSQLRYKASRHGARYIEANETGSSARCSACGARSGPEGRKGLRVRAWVCDRCGARHDRDINAAVNLLLGAERRPPAVEISAL